MTSLNERARALVEAALDRQETLRIACTTVDCGARLIDMGIQAEGGLSAGLEMARIGAAGLAEVSLDLRPPAGRPWPVAAVRSDAPFEGCYLSQAAHWSVKVERFQAMGSGPACLLNRALRLDEKYGLLEQAGCAVLILETRALPDDAVCRELAAQCGVSPHKLTLLAAPTSSLAGSVQIAARSIETALHKLDYLGFDLRRVVSGVGECPLAPPTGNDLTSLGKTNDAMMFGSRVWLAVRGATDAELSTLVERIPAGASPGYGEPFLISLKKAGGFYKMDAGLFAPAEVTLTNLDSGGVHHAGGVDAVRLRTIFEG